MAVELPISLETANSYQILLAISRCPLHPTDLLLNQKSIIFPFDSLKYYKRQVKKEILFKKSKKLDSKSNINAKSKCCNSFFAKILLVLGVHSDIRNSQENK